MSNFKEQYKTPRLFFGDIENNRKVRAHIQDKTRRESRTRAFDQNRMLQNISKSVSPIPENVATAKDERIKKLMKWREERNRKKKMETSKKKPVFKVGIVHHSLSSPWSKNEASSTTVKPSKQVKPQNDIPKRITRATEKRLLAKVNGKQKTVIAKNVASTSANHSTKSYTQNAPVSEKKKPRSFAPANHKFKAPPGVREMPLFGLVPVEETPQEKGDFFIKEKPSECQVSDVNDIKNDQKDVVKSHSQELNLSNAKKDTTKQAVATTPKPKVSPNELKSSEKLNELIPDLLNRTFEIKKTTRVSGKHVNDEKDSLQDKISSIESNDMNTPPKTVSVKSADSVDTGNFNTEDLISFSPYLTLSRGKKNARKEQQQRLGIGHSPSSEIPTKDTVMKSLNISVEEEERTAQYFKFLLNKETNRLQEICRKWLSVQSEQGVPDDAVYEINQAVGQTNLLINKKFKRFRGLVEDCETGKGEMLVTCRDLQGFWDMTYMEVENCDARFEKLEQRRGRQWQEVDCTVNKLASKKKRMPAKKQIASSKPSSLRLLILAARKKKMEAETNLSNKEDSLPEDASNESVTSSSSASRRSMTPRKYNSVQRNTRSRSINPDERRSSSATGEKSRANVIQRMSFSSASKKLKSPFAAIKISQMCKTPEVHLDDSITYINSAQTPGKSILKKSEELINKEARIKSAHKVNFDDVYPPGVSLTEEERRQIKLAAALNRIDSLDLDELSIEESIAAEKKLNFEFEDSDSSPTFEEFTFGALKQLQKQRSPAPNTSDLNVMHSGNRKTLSASFKEDGETRTPRKSLRHQVRHGNTSDKEHGNVSPLKTNVNTPIISEMVSNIETFKTPDNDESKVKVLRNRTITTNDIGKINRTSKMMTPKRGSISKKENKSPIKASRKSSMKLQKDEKKHAESKDMRIEMENVVSDIDKRRKSSRKSVAFDPEACLACTENKPVLPMTPHSKRRSKTPRLNRRSYRTFNEDLAS